ncbi:amidase domain-containing protein [Paenibacillus sp. 481]|uniref:amidase domain-containing protein n=1 Tax=Paenibacillus sp. 481 TaxID=2835869 RepID=UPI001E432845|nr:amidase domain-containing protein [Paenibacillus sp. 481]UHA74865.1 amidase domain-containing protein [Paenibacillus sp. 481]
MRQEWKNTLYLYVDQYNRNEVDDRNHALQAPIEDLEYVLKASERAKRLKGWYRERGTTPLKSETKAKLMKAREGENEVIADVEFHIQRNCEQRGLQIVEERIERERLTITNEGSGWVVSRVEAVVPERHSMRMKGSSIPGRDEHSMRSGRAQPFLNTDVLRGARSARSIPYLREKAVEYAEQWWNEANPRFLSFEDDCTNYVSQCLFAGGAPMNYTGRRETGWWYKGMVNGREAWSYSWAVADSLERLLTYNEAGLRATVVSRASDLQLGDIIAYDWDGNGHYQHNSIVTSFDKSGMPLVNAHTTNSRHRYWDYQDSYAWTGATQYRFLHIVDAF